jgi:AcrR family transcriptional regulator
MAREKSADKRIAILAAATEVLAELGPGAPTAKIARRAGVAEGTLFTYFSSKDALLNILYLELKSELREVLMASYPTTATARHKLHQAWLGLLEWGSTHPQKRKVLRQLSVSERITAASKERGAHAFGDFGALLFESIRNPVLRTLPHAYTAALLEALAESTMDFMAADAVHAECYREVGFDAFWNIIASPVESFVGTAVGSS